MRRLSCTWSRLTLTRALRSQHSFSPILQMKSPRLRAGGCPVRRKLGMQTRQRLRLKSYLFWYLLSQQMSLHILGSGCSYEMLFYLAIIWSILSPLKMERAQRPLFSSVLASHNTVKIPFLSPALQPETFSSLLLFRFPLLTIRKAVCCFLSTEYVPDIPF